MSFRLTVSVAAVLVPLATIVIWNRIRGPRVLRVAARVGLVLLGEGMATLALLAVLNVVYGGLIATWGDLFANLHSPPGGHHRHHHHGPKGTGDTPRPLERHR